MIGMIRVPDRYAQNIPEQHRKKWEEILLAIRKGELDRLASIQRTGSRGRIFYVIVKQMLHALEVPNRA